MPEQSVQIFSHPLWKNDGTLEWSFLSAACRGFLALITLVTSNGWIQSATAARIGCQKWQGRRAPGVWPVPELSVRGQYFCFTLRGRSSPGARSAGTFPFCSVGYWGMLAAGDAGWSPEAAQPASASKEPVCSAARLSWRRLVPPQHAVQRGEPGGALTGLRRCCLAWAKRQCTYWLVCSFASWSWRVLA